MVAFSSLHAIAQTRTEVRDTPLWVPLEKFDEKRNAAADIQLAVAEAKRSGRNVLLDVGGEWCVWCHRLDSLFVRNPDLNEFLHASFVVVKVNWSKNNKNEEVLSRYPKVAGYPHLFVLDETGRLLHSQDTSELEEGKGHSCEKVFASLRAWAPNHGK
ncbi:MAG: thioredoxin family protein [Bacteroidetes bacterium]|nr:thioredoxin family protein [Bacteroidota bacterium]MCW5896848.1 thioredoxin family protein [Bacteroidota bacterium]